MCMLLFFLWAKQLTSTQVFSHNLMSACIQTSAVLKATHKRYLMRILSLLLQRSNLVCSLRHSENMSERGLRGGVTGFGTISML